MYKRGCGTLTTCGCDRCRNSQQTIYLNFQLTCCRNSLLDVGSLRIGILYGLFFYHWNFSSCSCSCCSCSCCSCCDGCVEQSGHNTDKKYPNIIVFQQSLGLQDIHNLERSRPQDSGEDRRPPCDNEIDANQKTLDFAKRSRWDMDMDPVSVFVSTTPKNVQCAPTRGRKTLIRGKEI